jgi:MerR family transcriptional regulator, heat shock protein HspR
VTGPAPATRPPVLPSTGRPVAAAEVQAAPTERGVPDAADASRAVYVISVAAELAGVHPQTLRVYERKGLLDPSRTIGGSRRFSELDLARLRRIQDLTAAGLNLEGVRRVLELESEVARLRGELDRARAEGREAVERIHRQYRRDLVPFDAAPIPYVPGRRRTGR